VRLFRQKHLIALVAGGLVLVIVAGWLVIARFDEADRLVAWQDPKGVLEWRSISPTLAMQSLEGSASQTIFVTAISQNDVHTAYATLVYAIELDPERKSGLLLWLAQSQPEKNTRSVRAIRLSCYQMAAAIATVALDMADLTKANTLLQAGLGMADLAMPAQALFYLDQVYAIARHSQQLTQAHRRILLDKLIPLYQSLGRQPDTWQELVEQTNTLVSPDRYAFTGHTPVLERPQLIYSNQDAIQAAAARQRITEHIRQELESTAQKTSSRQMESLAIVLKHEDQVHLQSYEAWQGRQVDLFRDRAAWMTIKSRVAHKGFGVSIVPEWEEQVDDIDAELTAALLALVQYQGTELPKAAFLLQLEYGLLGYCAGWPQVEWADEVIRWPHAALYIAVRRENNNVFFFLDG
jgi:hypothetical protein